MTTPLLLDTRTLLWWFADGLPPATTTTIATAGEAYVSAASVWEIEVAQAIEEGMTLVSRDRQLSEYGTAVIWA